MRRAWQEITTSRLSQATSDDIRANDEKLVGIDALARPNEILPPALALARLLGDVVATRGDMTRRAQTSVKQDGVRSVRVELSPSLVGDRKGRQGVLGVGEGEWVRVVIMEGGGRWLRGTVEWQREKRGDKRSTVSANQQGSRIQEETTELHVNDSQELALAIALQSVYRNASAIELDLEQPTTSITASKYSKAAAKIAPRAAKPKQSGTRKTPWRSLLFFRKKASPDLVAPYAIAQTPSDSVKGVDQADAG